MSSSTNMQYVDLLRAFECPDATYKPDVAPLVFARAKGSEIWDVDGQRYIDVCAGFGALALGHHPDIFADVWREFADSAQPGIMHGMGDVYASADKARLIERLATAVAPHLDCVGLALSGGQAVEFALKTALLKTKRSGFMAFADGYHGLDLGVLPVTANARFRAPFQSWMRADQVEFLNYASPIEQLDEEFKQAIVQQRQRGIGTAAVIVEPIQGRGGVRVAPLTWLARLRALCDEHDVLLIFDEIFTGLGRTGRLTFADKIACDLLCLGKALGGGLPLSACLGRRAVMHAWPKSTGEALHTGTFFGHPLACRLGLLTLNAIIDNELPRRSQKLGVDLKTRLSDCLLPHVKEVRGEGLMLAIEFHEPARGAQMMDQLRAAGVIALASGPRGEALSLSPALTISQDLLDEVVGVLQRLIKQK